MQTNTELSKTGTLYSNKFSKGGLLKLAKLLKDSKSSHDFLNTHSSVLSCFANLKEACEFIKTVTENALDWTQYDSGRFYSTKHVEAMNLLINCLKPILSRPCKFEELIEFLASLRSSNGYALEISKIYFVKALKACITNAGELANIIPHLNGNNEKVNFIKTMLYLITNANELISIVSLVEGQNRLDIINEKKSLITNASDLANILPLLNGNDEQVNFIKAMHHLITNDDELAVVASKVAVQSRLDIINFKTAHWELECRPKCRLAFLGGSVRPEAGNHSFFAQTIPNGPKGIQDLKLMILDNAGLGPYHSPDGIIKETNHTLKFNQPQI